MTVETVIDGPVFIGPSPSPAVLIGTLLVVLLVLFVGRMIVGLAWRLVLVALVAVVGLWFLGVLGMPP